MNDQPDERLIVSPDTTDLERRLLRSWEAERPSPAARAQTLGALGLASAGLGAAASVSLAPKALTAGWLGIAKWTAIAVAVVAAGGAGTYVVTHHGTTAQTTTPANNVVLPVTPNKVQAAPAVTAPTTPIELPDTPRVATGHAAAPAASSLAQQIAAVDRARASLDTGDTQRARRLVDAYETEYPGGAFTQEAEVVRIDALVREGNRADADRVGKRFLGAYPKSPHATRVRALLGYDP
jgi:hypothetical protein